LNIHSDAAQRDKKLKSSMEYEMAASQFEAVRKHWHFIKIPINLKKMQTHMLTTH
jgi:hypothetical protein